MLALLAEHTDAAAAQPQHEEQQLQHHRHAQWHDGHHRTEINPASSQPGASSTAAQPQLQPQPEPEPEPELETDAMSDAMSDFSGDDEFLSADEDEYHHG